MAAQLDAGAYALGAGEGEQLAWFGATPTIKASTAAIGVVEITLHPGEEPPLHIHTREDEYLYVLDGEVAFHAGDEQFRAGAGGFVSFPRDLVHTFTVESESARLLVIVTPGGFERMFELAPQTPEEAAAAMAAFGMDPVGPNPGHVG
jgi:quercetin dioxygenase-like cupin family protein